MSKLKNNTYSIWSHSSRFLLTQVAFLWVILFFSILYIEKPIRAVENEKIVTMTEYCDENNAQDATVITICSKAELVLFRNYSNNESKENREFDGKVIRLIADIEMSDCTFSYDREKGQALIYRDDILTALLDSEGYLWADQKHTQSTTWEQIGLDTPWESISKSDSFRGTFDGNGKVITGLYIFAREKNRTTGLFGNVWSSKIENVILDNAFLFAGKQDAAFVCGSAHLTTVSGCAVSGCAVGVNAGVGGVLGSVGDVDVQNCSFSGSIGGGNKWEYWWYCFGE